MEINITKLEQTEAFGKAIASFLANSNDFNIIYLDGNLGAGKTTLVRSILKALGWSGAVKSPTFSILEEYHIKGIDIFHTDLYRLDGQNDFDMLGLEINQNKTGVLFVEWPEKIEKFGIGNEIYIQLEDKIECRLANISSDNQDFLSCIDGVELNNPT